MHGHMNDARSHERQNDHPQFTLLPVKPYHAVSFPDHEGHFPEVDSLRQNCILKPTQENAKRQCTMKRHTRTRGHIKCDAPAALTPEKEFLDNHGYYY